MSHSDTIWPLFDFGDAASVADWRAIDDRVMGGVSRSRLRHDPAGHAVFEGVVSLEHRGGFASVRSAPARRGRAGAQACVIEACAIEAPADGRRFKLALLTHDAVDGIGYQAGFAAGAGWQTLQIPLEAFRANYRGREVPEAPALDPGDIRQVGLLIAGRQAGAFALGVRRIGLA